MSDDVHLQGQLRYHVESQTSYGGEHLMVNPQGQGAEQGTLPGSAATNSWSCRRFTQGASKDDSELTSCQTCLGLEQPRIHPIPVLRLELVKARALIQILWD